MERLHIATVGMTTDPILKGFTRYPVDRLVLLHSPETLSYAEEIVKVARGFPDVSCQLMEIDPFALDSIVSAILRVRRERPMSRLSINITGGTNVMAAGALLAGFIVGADVYYVPEKPMESKESGIEDLVIELPVPKVTWDSIRETQRRILKAILKEGGTMKAPGVRLADLLGITQQGVSYHLNSLVSKGLMEVIEDRKTKTVALSSTGRLFARIF
jgi:DNA-binding transcriptional ArsR family regulator